MVKLHPIIPKNCKCKNTENLLSGVYHKNIASYDPCFTSAAEIFMQISGSNFWMLGDGTMLLLVGLAFLLGIYIIERAIFLHSGNIKPQQFINGITALLKNGRYNEAVTICEETPGFIPNIVKIALVFHKNIPEKMEYAVQNFVLSIIPNLERRLRSIALLGKIAPMISCIGACIIFANFITYAQINITYIQSERLFSVVGDILEIISLGIFLNICANIGYSFLYGRVQRLISNMEWSYNEITNFLSIEENGNAS